MRKSHWADGARTTVLSPSRSRPDGRQNKPRTGQRDRVEEEQGIDQQTFWDRGSKPSTARLADCVCHDPRIARIAEQDV